MASPHSRTMPALLALVALAIPPTLTLFPAVALPAAVATAASADPRQVVTSLAAQLLTEVDRNRSALRRDPEQLLPVVDRIVLPHFDTDYTARLILGPHGRAATPEQRARFAVAIYHALFRAYAGALADFTADQLQILREYGDPSGSLATVRTRVTRPGGAILAVDYRLHRTAQGWQAIDLIVEGISYVRNYRMDFDAEIREKGLDRVIARLEQRETTAALSATAPSGGSENAR